MRGLISALFLAELEKRAGQPVASLFDLVVGTSTGGILALGLNVPSPSDPKKPLYSAADIADLYINKGRDIFKQSIRNRFAVLNWIQDEKYHAAGLEGVLKNYFGHTTIHQSVTDVMVACYDIERRESFFFKCFHRSNQAGLIDVPMWEAARCTTAGPTYFEPYKIAVPDAIGYRVLIDGGVFANNPAMCAYSEARRRYPDNEFLLISVGSGKLGRPYRYEEVKDMRMFRWAYPITDIMMNGVGDIVDYQLEQLLNRNENYFRFQEDLRNEAEAWDDARPRHLRTLETIAANLIEHNSALLDQVIDLLKGPGVLQTPDTKGSLSNREE